MSRCATPDKLIGIGGGGSKVVYRFMDQDWILDEVLATEKYEQEEPDSLHARVIDTAERDNWHDQRAASVEEKVRNKIAESGFEPQDDYLKFDGPVQITERISDPWKGSHLTDPTVVPELCEDQKLQSWWIQEGREPLSRVNEKGFGGGVYRRRGVSKLLYHVTEFTDNSVTPRVSDDDQVAIVATLGGGTGSGMAIDLASNLSGANTHLYAILPHDQSSGNERTNAMAALSELEYLFLTKETPFESVTLIPHLEAVEDRDRAFEMAVVRTILAHQNGVQGGNLVNKLLPGENKPNAPPTWAPFSMAAPYTIKYNIHAAEKAENEIEDNLQGILENQRRESNLYEIVDEYLSEWYPDTAKPVLEGEINILDANSELDIDLEPHYKLKERLEDEVRESLLEQPVFKVAGLGDEIEAYKEAFDEVLDDETVLGITEDDDSLEQAVKVIDNAPSFLEDKLETLIEDHDPGSNAQLLGEVLLNEVKNVEKRSNLWEATEAITADNTSFDEKDAVMVRKAVREVILDPETEYLRERFVDPSVQDRLEDLLQEANELKETRNDIRDIYDDVVMELQSRISDWHSEVYENAQTLAAINEYRQSAESALNDLERELDAKAEEIEAAQQTDTVDDIRFDLSSVGPLGDADIEGLEPLNEKLDDMGVQKIKRQEIRSGFKNLKDARKAHIDHGSHPILPGPDESESFENSVAAANTNGWFEVNPTSPSPDVEDNFRARFNRNKLPGEFEIEEQRDKVITQMVGRFRENFTQNNTLMGFNMEYSSGHTNTDSISIPQNTNISSLEKGLQDSLENTVNETADELLDDVLPVSCLPEAPEDATGASTATSTIGQSLYDSYLRPIVTKLEEVNDRLSDLVDETEESHTGEIDRLAGLKAISAGHANEIELDVALPEANPNEPDPETYGRQFAQEYVRDFKIELDQELEGTSGDNPYVRRKEVDPIDVIDSPSHIGESDVYENRKEEISSSFENRTRRLGQNEVGRLPINELELEGTGDREEDITAVYNHLRFRPIYMSRALENSNGELSFKYEEVREEVEEEITTFDDPDVYGAETYGSGGPDEITQVMFVGGVFLDNIKMASKRGGYHDTYLTSHNTSEFIGGHHTIGLGGSWHKWRQMEEIATKQPEIDSFDNGFGGFVHRHRVRNIDQEFVDELMLAHETDHTDQDGKDIFMDLLEVDVFESTVDLNS